MKEQENDYLKIIEKVNGADFLIKKGLLIFYYEKESLIINYLIWHSLSSVGKAKFCNSLYFLFQLRHAMDYGRVFPENKDLKIIVDYGDEPNDYEKQGYQHLVNYNPLSNFSVI